MKKLLKKILLVLALTIGVLGLLFFFTKGGEGTPLPYQYDHDVRAQGPFESSGTNSRYALTEAIARDRSLFFTEEQAIFASPDVVEYQGKYFTIFTPGVSFLAAPLYLLGNRFGIPQLGAFATTALVSITNMLLVYLLAKKMGSDTIPAALSGFLFLFGTNALGYAFTLTQHHYSVLIILTSVLLLFQKTTIFTNIAFGFLYGAGLLMDIPNGIMLAPLMISVFFSHFSTRSDERSYTIRIKFHFLAILIGLAVPLAIFGWYNKTLTGSYTTLGQFIGRYTDIDPGKPPVRVPESVDLAAPKYPYYTRFQLNGLYILLVSNERGWIYYMPIVALGVWGLVLAHRRKEYRNAPFMALTIIGTDIVSYSMFGDPWGGWSYGPRYLLPATALAAIGIGVYLTKYKRTWFLGALYALVAIYSIHIATLGALTTNSVPPKGEAERLITFIPYTYEYNAQLLSQNKLSSLVYNQYLQQIVSGPVYHRILEIILMATGLLPFAIYAMRAKTVKQK